LFRFFTIYRWWLLGLGTGITILLTFIGLGKAFVAAGLVRTPLDTLYVVLQLFRIVSVIPVTPVSWELEVARFLIPVILFSTLISVIVTRFSTRARIASLRFTRGHAIIWAARFPGLLLTRQFLEQGYPVVGIAREGEGGYGDTWRGGAPVIPGDPRDPSVLDQAWVSHARFLVLALERDDLNAALAIQAWEIAHRAPGGSLTCFVHIVDPGLCNLLRAIGMAAGRGTGFRLEFFNVFENAGRSMVEQYPPFPEGVEPPEAHMLVIGVGRMGESVIYQAVRAWYTHHGLSGKRLLVTLVDRQGDARRTSLLQRYPSLSKYADLHACTLDVQSPEFLEGRTLSEGSGELTVSTVYICLGNPSLGLMTALALYQRFGKRSVPIILRTRSEEGFTSLLEALDEGVLPTLHPFPEIDPQGNLETTLNSMYERIARAIHEEYLSHQVQKEVPLDSTPAMVPWDSLPGAIQEANRLQADDIYGKLRAIGCDLALVRDWDDPLLEFTPAEVEILAQREHERWMGEMQRTGWQYGEQRDEGRHLHPSMVPWEELSEKEREKDRNPVRILPQILKRVDLAVVRRAT
jgi:voltage-gated potassium channel Kch